MGNHETSQCFSSIIQPSKKVKVKSIVFDTPQVFDFFKVDSDAALLPS